jgi:folate-binding protein YgfZ
MDTIDPLPAVLASLQDTSFVLPLPPRSVLRVRGTDAARYLEGQLSNSVSRSLPDAWMRACLLTIKGKLIAAPLIRRDASNGDFLIEVENDLLGEVTARLERYIVADDVEILPAVPSPFGFHGIGESFRTASASAPCALRFHMLGIDLESAPKGVTLCSPAQSEAIRIAAGIPAAGVDWTQDNFPVEVGLDESAVDFHKGCYVGQEVVSRLESVGEARRKLVRWIAEKENECPPIGATIFSPKSESSRTLGAVTSATTFAGMSFGLAMLRKEAAAQGAVLKAAEATICVLPTVRASLTLN